MKNVLLIAYFYPPLSGAGAVRPAEFSRYLPLYGWRTQVLTVMNDVDYPRDQSLWSVIPADQRICRAYRLPVFTILKRLARGALRSQTLLYSFLDPQYDWVPAAIALGKRMLRTERFDAILASAPPYSALRVARALREFSGLPAVADIRDPFTANELAVFPTRFHRSFYRIYERRLLANMDHILIASARYFSDIRDAVGLRSVPITHVPNGYDPEEFEGTEVSPPTERFVLGYIGSIYGPLSPLPFFRAVRGALDKQPLLAEYLRMRFVGRMDKTAVLRSARATGVEDFVEVLGFRPHVEAVQLTKSCHALVTFGGMVSKSIPAKVYEYAAAGRMTISFEKPGMLSGFMSNNGLGWDIDGDDPTQGADIILSLFTKFISGEPLPSPAKANRIRFSRRELAGKVAQVLDSVCRDD